MWCCLFFNFCQFVILENLSIFDLALLGVKGLIPCFSVTINWTDWSAAPADCEEFCSNVGGTITASRQCFTSSVTLSKEEECAKYNNETRRVFPCDEQCDMSSGNMHNLSE